MSITFIVYFSRYMFLEKLSFIPKKFSFKKLKIPRFENSSFYKKFLYYEASMILTIFLDFPFRRNFLKTQLFIVLYIIKPRFCKKKFLIQYFVKLFYSLFVTIVLLYGFLIPVVFHHVINGGIL